MAYGLDFEEIYYADHNRYDLGVLETYEIEIDLANEKDFRIVSPDPVIPIGGFWYIQDTEYGGIVDAFHTDSDEEQIEYEGRSFRGILNSHIVDVNGKERIIPSETAIVVNGNGAVDSNSEMIIATISDCFRELVTDFGDLFIVDEPDVDESVSTTVSSYSIKAGTTVYEALMGLAKSIDFSFTLQYKSDKRIHITPILTQDYTDYIKGSKYEGLGFQTEITTNVVNHLISTAINEETGELYRIHFFADENGGIQPYTTVDNPIKDEQFILDKSMQVLTGIDEIAEYVESGVNVIENYELLSGVPDDWSTNFGSYYKHNFDDDGNESWDEYEAVGEEKYTFVPSMPSDWATNYSSYYTSSYDETQGKYVYNNVYAESVLDLSSAVAITSIPYDWTSNYNEYYYKFQTGTGIEYRQYDGETKNNFVRLTSKPSDWNENFSSYYRKVFKKETETKKGGKTKILVDYIKAGGEYYTTCKADDDKKNGKVPSFSKRAHYRNDSYTVAPNFIANNCYRINRVEVAPTFDPVGNRYYSMKMEYHAPTFVIGEGYAKVYDHYSSMAEDAIAFFEDEKRKSSQRMDLEDFIVNIGDIVGGTDEFTKTNVIGSITNIEAKIENGLIDVAYSVTVDDYTTQISAKRQIEEE